MKEENIHHAVKVTRPSMKGPVVNVQGLELCAVCCLCESLTQLSVQESGMEITEDLALQHLQPRH